MSESEEVDQSVRRTDRWSKVIALFAALGTYLVATLLVVDFYFAMIVAAFAGIGARIYVPYHARRSVTDAEGTDIAEYAAAGEYHYGAVGGALIIGPLFAILIRVLEPSSNVALAVGAGATVVAFVALQFALPK